MKVSMTMILHNYIMQINPLINKNWVISYGPHFRSELGYLGHLYWPEGKHRDLVSVTEPIRGHLINNIMLLYTSILSLI